MHQVVHPKVEPIRLGMVKFMGKTHLLLFRQDSILVHHLHLINRVETIGDPLHPKRSKILASKGETPLRRVKPGMMQLDWISHSYSPVMMNFVSYTHPSLARDSRSLTTELQRPSTARSRNTILTRTHKSNNSRTPLRTNDLLSHVRLWTTTNMQRASTVSMALSTTCRSISGKNGEPSRCGSNPM